MGDVFTTPHWELYDEFDDVADRVEGAGVDMSEYDENGLRGDMRERVGRAMDHLETAGYHAREAAKIMKAVAEETEGTR